MTSCEIVLMSTGSPTGTCRSLISAWPPGCSNFHIHCRPMAWISSAFAGGCRSPSKMPRTPGEEGEREGERDQHPGEFDLDVTVAGVCAVRLPVRAVDEREPGDGDEDGHGEQQRRPR